MTHEQQQRYNRHIVLEDIGLAGQERLLAASVLVVGAGGLGSAVLQYLAASGVGTLGIVDGDVVSLSNLQRQVIHTTADLSRPKTQSAKEKIRTLNPDVDVKVYDFFLDCSNATSIVSNYDFIIDATDNFKAKYLINDVCVRLNKPFCMGGVTGFCFQLMTHLPGTSCYRCLFPDFAADEKPDSGVVMGVLSPLVGVCGTLLAVECIKYFVCKGDLLINKMACFDALSMTWSIIDVCRNSKCELCSNV